MKAFGLFTLICLACVSLLFVACSGGSGNTDSAMISMSVTDAKPMLPENVTNLFVEFSGIWVHKSGAGWKQLAMVESPCTIDLLQFHDGSTAELVPPVLIEAGHYTQVRIGVDSATLRFDNDGVSDDRVVEIPSGHLKTDKNFTIEMSAGTAIDIVIHFDLSQSVVVTGPASDPAYKLKPVLHLFEDPLRAATFVGLIDNASFGDSEKATVAVYAESNGEEYTRVEIVRSMLTDPTEFQIFWIVPDQTYTVWIDLDQDGEKDCEDWVDHFVLPEGAVYSLNDGVPIKTGEGICP